MKNFLSFLSALLLFSCSSANLTTGEELANDDILRQNPDKSYEGKRVTFTGYLVLPDHNLFEGRGKDMVSFSLSNKPCGLGEDAEDVCSSFEAESSSLGKNVVEIPSQFDESNVTIHTHDGKGIKCNQKMKVSGTVRYGENQKPVMTVKIDPKTMQQSDFANYAYSLEDIRFDAAE